ncbi:MAG: 1,4-dihydroxy-2-naphthoate polyprenyltransferase [Chloroflexi bacterium]|nr:1,4-dihydroxy-2-naphthoate polyprenyltransferase [Chloroflexota bacterium]
MPDPTPAAPNAIQRWQLAIRPRTLPAAAAPVLVGAALAYSQGGFRPLAALAALLGALLIQIGTNLVNDVADFARGTDNETRLGPTRVTQAGLLTPRQVWAGAATAFGLAALAGVYLIRVGGWPLLVIGLLSILAGVAYTAGPFPLAYNGLGDVFVFIFFGLVAVGGTTYVSGGSLGPAVWLAGAAVGALVVNILAVNNIRDIASDRAAGRTNLAVRFGRRAAEWEYAAMLALAFAAPLVMAAAGQTGPWVLACFLALPQALGLHQTLRGGLAGPGLNAVLGQTAQLALRYSLLLALGITL